MKTSLIEQAAKRLEELKRAGVESAEAAPPVASAPMAQPSPEAMVLALEGRTHGSPAFVRGERKQEARVDRADADIRHIDINFAKLKARGFVTPDAGSSQIAEEFRVIKRPIIRNALGIGGVHIKHGNLVMVTSALPGEGKTFTSVNLALSIAMEFNSTVLLVDGDVAHPTLPSLLGVPGSPGLLDLLLSGTSVADALIKTNVDRLSVLPAGSRHERATELLASEQMAALLHELSARYPDRIIVFDSPPLLATTEARVMATHMGQIVMVVAADQTTQHAVTQALATIDSCEVVLMMLNKSSHSDMSSYYGYYANRPER